MNRLTQKLQNNSRRKNKVKAMVRGTAERPRLSIRVSNLHMSAQVINDESGKTLASATTVGSKVAKGTMTAKAEWLGEEIGKKAKAAKVKKVALDRGEKLYHGRVKALAEAARKSGLEF